MNTSPTDSGPGNSYQQYSGDSTRPNTSQQNSNLSDIVLGKIMLNIDTIKSDIQGIKFNLEQKENKYIPEISIGVISSFIVSIIFLLITSNLGKEEYKLLGITIPTFFLLVFGMFLTWFTTYFLTKKTAKKKKKSRNK